MSEVGRHLALLVQEPSPMPEPDTIDHALAGRESAHLLLDALHHENALGRRAAGHLSVSELTRNPTGVMNRLRSDLPRFPVPDAHLLLAAEGATRASRLWLGLHRHAVVARHEWQTADPRTRPTAESAWPVIADGAAIVGALVALDRHLAPALLSAGKGTEADQLQESRWSGLRLAAAEVRALTGAGDLTDPPPLRKPGLPNPVVVRSRAGQREGHRRLSQLLRETPDQHPVQLQAVATRLGRMALGAAPLVQDPRLAAVLGENARDLQRGAQALNRVDALIPRDGRALMQAAQLERFVAGALAAGGNQQDVGMTVARELAGACAAVAACAERQVREGRWLIADGSDPARPLWVQADTNDHRPDALTHLATAAANARQASALALPDSMPAYAPSARLSPARASLGDVLDTAEERRRPASPSQRLAPPKDRGR